MNELNIITVAGVSMLLRFDLGTARALKALAGIDVIAGYEDGANQDSIPEKIFLAAYKRGCMLYKTPQVLTDSEAIEAYYELSTAEAINVMTMFTAAVSAEPAKKESNTDSAKEGEVKNV